jgi:hypothetical protein
MTGDGHLRARDTEGRLVSALAARIGEDGTLPKCPEELRLRLNRLAEERILAREWGLARVSAYVKDLDRELSRTRAAYAEAVILELALLRAELEGRNEG